MYFDIFKLTTNLKHLVWQNLVKFLIWIIVYVKHDIYLYNLLINILQDTFIIMVQITYKYLYTYVYNIQHYYNYFVEIN